MHIEIASINCQGARDYNEDSHGQWQNERFTACLVADGAGGEGGGDIASQLACATMLDLFGRNPTLDGDVLRSMLETANESVLAQQLLGGLQAQMRTTVVFLALDTQTQQAAWVHAGDSRLYHFRHRCLLERSIDHSVVQEMVNNGMLTEEQARAHPHRNLISSALGAQDGSLEISVTGPVSVQPEDAFLLCSDGVWEPLGDAQLSETLGCAMSPKDWLSQLKERITRVGKKGQDNFTAVAIWLSDNDETTVLLPDPSTIIIEKSP